MHDLPTANFEEWSAALDAGVATVELDHEKSAITERGLVELRDTLEHLIDRDDVQVVVLAGGSEAFCVGMDVGEFATLVAETPDDEATRRRRIREFIRTFHESILAIRRAPQPVVAAVDGTAAGGGLSLVLAADYVVASTDAAFTHAYTDIGATADGGSTYFLPHLVGMQTAKELVFTPQPVSPERMAELGVVNDVVDREFQAIVDERARELAQRPAEAIAHTKRLLNRGIESPLESHLEAEREAMAEIVTTEAFEQRVQAFAERE